MIIQVSVKPGSELRYAADYPENVRKKLQKFLDALRNNKTTYPAAWHLEQDMRRPYHHMTARDRAKLCENLRSQWQEWLREIQIFDAMAEGLEFSCRTCVRDMDRVILDPRLFILASEHASQVVIY